MSTRSSINFNVFEKIYKEVLPVKETKASMGRGKKIRQNKDKKVWNPSTVQEVDMYNRFGNVILV